MCTIHYYVLLISHNFVVIDAQNQWRWGKRRLDGDDQRQRQRLTRFVLNLRFYLSLVEVELTKFSSQTSSKMIKRYRVFYERKFLPCLPVFCIRSLSSINYRRLQIYTTAADPAKSGLSVTVRNSVKKFPDPDRDLDQHQNRTVSRHPTFQKIS